VPDFPGALISTEPSIIPTDTKLQTSARLNEVLLKMIDFSHHPGPDILLGDSRMNNLDVTAVRRLSKRNYYNLAYGGAALDEVIDSFWFAATTSAPLHNVYIASI
jgi:hypothetical protein